MANLQIQVDIEDKESNRDVVHSEQDPLLATALPPVATPT